jgi:hypothetical protein
MRFFPFFCVLEDLQQERLAGQSICSCGLTRIISNLFFWRYGFEPEINPCGQMRKWSPCSLLICTHFSRKVVLQTHLFSGCRSGCRLKSWWAYFLYSVLRFPKNWEHHQHLKGLNSFQCFELDLILIRIKKNPTIVQLQNKSRFRCQFSFLSANERHATILFGEEFRLNVVI